MKSRISIIIYTRNEEENIKGCIQSAMILSKEILVVDMNSLDRTVKIAKELGAEIYSFPCSDYVEPAREFGIRKAKTDWVFILDADERISKELAIEIKGYLKNPKKPRVSHYKIPRKNLFGGKTWLRHGGWWPDYQIRFLNKKYFKRWPREIHSTPVIKGKLGFIKTPLIHYFHGDFEEMVKKTIIFENIEAELLYKAKRETNTIIFFRKFFGELFRRLIKKRGFLDGDIGIIETVYQAFSKTITYLFLYEKKHIFQGEKSSPL